MFDLAAYLPRLEAVWCVDDALRRNVTTPSALARVRDGRLGGRGDALARRRIEDADGIAESILETAGRLALVEDGVARPVAQFAVRDGRGRLIARLDGAYPERKLALEFDGQSFHSAPPAVFRDRRRQNALELEGWRVLRFHLVGRRARHRALRRYSPGRAPSRCRLASHGPVGSGCRRRYRSWWYLQTRQLRWAA